MKRLWPFVWRHRGLFLLSLILAPFLSVLNLAQPFLVKEAIDHAIIPKNLPLLQKITLFYVAIFILEYILNFLQVYVLQLTGQKVVFDLRQKLFEKLEQIDAKYFDKTPIGVTLTRFTSDCESINELLASGIVSLGWDLLRLILTVGAMAYLNWKLTLVTLSMVPLLWLVVRYCRRRLYRAYQMVREKVADLNAFLQEHVSGVRVIQLFGKEVFCSARFAKINRAFRDANMDTVHYDAVLYALVEAISSFAIALLIWYGAGGLMSGVVSFGVLVAFIQYIDRFFVPIRDLAAKFAIIQSASVAVGKIFAFLDRPSDLQIVPTPREVPKSFQTITFSNVDFSYDGKKKVIHNLSFQVRRGAKMAFVGMTGSGKSTIFKLLNRTYDLAGGSILFDDVPMHEMDVQEVRSLFVHISQEVFLFSGTIEENIRLFSPEFTSEAVVRAAVSVGANAFIRRLSDHYQHHVSSRGANLSMGERQLIALARGVLLDRPILLLDEATAHIDPWTSRLLDQAIAKVSKDRTVLIAAHRLHTVKTMDQILVIHAGEMREIGSHEELMRAGGLYSHLCQVDLVTA